MHVAQYLDQPTHKTDSWPTGLGELDRVTGGFRRGRVWVLCGAPGSGKSALLTQFVHLLAVKHAFEVVYQPGAATEPAQTRARLLSLAVRRAASLPGQHVPLVDLTSQQQASVEALREASLEIGEGGGFTIPTWSAATTRPRCLALDDPEGRRPPVLAPQIRQDLRRMADDDALVLLTAPLSSCLEASPDGTRLREEWASVADVIMELVPGRAGGAMLRLWLNRLGPTTEIAVVTQWHLARVVDAEA